MATIKGKKERPQIGKFKGQILQYVRPLPALEPVSDEPRHTRADGWIGLACVVGAFALAAALLWRLAA